MPRLGLGLLCLLMSLAQRSRLLYRQRVAQHLARRAVCGALRGLASWANLEIGETFSPGNSGLAGRLVRDVALERGQDPWDVVCELAVADRLRTIFWTTGHMAPESARQRVETLRRV